MTAAGAADGNGEIRLALFLELGKKKVDEAVNVVQKRAGCFVGVHVLDDICIGAGVRFEVRHKIGIGKKSNVKDQVGIDRYAVLETIAQKLEQKVRSVPFFK